MENFAIYDSENDFIAHEPEYKEDTSFRELVSTDNFRLLKANYLSAYPYQIEVFTPAYGWEIIMDLCNSDLAELINLFNKYTEEK